MSDEADDIATNILHHIDSMYPKMWEGVSRDSARTSIRNTILREVAATIEQLTQENARLKDHDKYFAEEFDQQDREYNRKTNKMIDRHAEQIAHLKMRIAEGE